MAEEKKFSDKVTILGSPGITALFSIIRDKETGMEEYVRNSDLLLQMLTLECFGVLAPAKDVTTPCGVYKGSEIPDFKKMIAVSIMRSGCVLCDVFRKMAPGSRVGKILIQRDEADEEKKATLFYSKLPTHTADDTIFVTDPMIATGGSMICALEVLFEKGIKEEQIVILCVVACPEGVEKVAKMFPKVRIVCGAMDSHLNENKYIVPGLGDFGDRYYGTD